MNMSYCRFQNTVTDLADCMDALSELDMMNLWAKQLTGYKSQWERLFGFGYAVEAEVRKQDDALIMQLVEALEGYRRNHNDTQPCDAERAGRARLGRPHD